jgi:uncharacterized membrane protein
MKTLPLLSAWALLAFAGIPNAFGSSAYTCTSFTYGSAANNTSLTGINNKGQVVGSWSNPGEPGQSAHAFRRDADGTLTSLISPSGNDLFVPIGINNLGQILGQVTGQTGISTFILNPDGSFTDIALP